MSNITKALLLGLVVPFLVVSWRLYPNVLTFRDCYKEAKDLMSQKGYVSRRAYTSAEQICSEKKQFILESVVCFNHAEAYFEDDLASRLAKIIGKQIAFSATETDELIERHNTDCAEEEGLDISDQDIRHAIKDASSSAEISDYL